MENRDIIGSMLTFMHLHRQKVHTCITEAGLYHGQLPILEVVDQNNGCTQKELAEKLHVSAPSITNSIKRLERKELLNKTFDDKDSRYSKITITDKGKEITRQTRVCFDAVDEKCLQCLSDEEKESLYSLIRKLVENIEKEEKYD